MHLAEHEWTFRCPVAKRRAGFVRGFFSQTGSYAKIKGGRGLVGPVARFRQFGAR